MANNKPVNFFVGRCTKAVSIFLLSSFTLCCLMFVSLSFSDFVSYSSLFALGTLKIKADSTPQRTVSQEKKENLTPLFYNHSCRYTSKQFLFFTGMAYKTLRQINQDHHHHRFVYLLSSPRVLPGDLFKNNTLLFALSNIYVSGPKGKTRVFSLCFFIKFCCKKEK